MFLLADRPHLFPGRCLLGDSRGPCIDTGVEMELGGHVYLNRTEACEVGRLFGLVEADAHEVVVRERDLALDSVVVLEAELAEARSVIEALRCTIRLVEPPDPEPVAVAGPRAAASAGRRRAA
jgi:hypothetical protein